MVKRYLHIRAALGAALAVASNLPTLAGAQTDNFDTYSSVQGFMSAGWTLSQMGPVTTTFPAVGTGKGLRVQANPVPGEAPAASVWYRTTEYTDFYMAVDLVKWAPTNQSVALLARGSIVDDPGGASGYLVNYNVAALGDPPLNPQQGELQITILYPDFSTAQLAIGEVTFEPGRPYRIVFTGVGFHFMVRVYDLLDLTKPLFQMQADDTYRTYTNGICGLMTFSRDDVIGTTDVTLDNYEIATYDPNPANAPALAYPIPGTPTIDTRVPSERFSNFCDPSVGISFTANTFTTDVVDIAATKLRLNGVDVSNRLSLSGNGSSMAAYLPGTALTPHSVYSAQIEVQDISGQKRSTNTFWFDTFSDAYLSSSEVKVIEAEDYNYSNGLYQLDPIPVSGPDTNGTPVRVNGRGYFELHGIEGVDFHDKDNGPEPLWASEYREFDSIGLCQGMYPEIQDGIDQYGDTRYSDHVRSKYATNGMLEFVVHRTAPGEWLNYTRNFDIGVYNAWLRVASLGATQVRLDRVVSDPSLPGQTTTNLGTFFVPNQFTRYNYRYVPLLDSAGLPALLSLSGETTLRLSIAGISGEDADKLALNYMLFVPNLGTVRLYSSSSLIGPYVEEPLASVDSANRRITVPAAGTARFYRVKAGIAIEISSFSLSGGIITITY